nr:MAG TPA: tail sheath protein [Caudoviricetes sp.]
MFKSIPASQIVSVNPSVLSSGGSPLALNSVFLSKNANIPTGESMLFATAESVGEHFGFSSDEYKAAQIYFKGFDGSNKKPGRLYFYALNSVAEAGYLLGASVKTTSLAELKKIKGSLNVTIDGAEKKAPSIDLKSATSFSEAAQQIGSALSATVEFEEQLQAFKIVSATTGKSSAVSFATGDIADKLGLSETAGARVSKGTNAESVDEMMAGLTAATLNFATFTTIEEPTIEDKLALAKWSNLQNERFLYVGWGKEAAALQAGNTTSFGAKLKESQYSGATAVYGGLDKAAFLCGAIASIDFSEREGRITVAFKGQSGLEVDVNDATEAQNLKDNGYNFYGAWATANDRFLFMYPGQMTGKWKWLDNYVNQIRLNSQLQLALMTMLTSAKSVPYNAVGRALHRAACQDAIDEALNFGSIRAGVDLSEQQRAIINNEAGVDAASQIEARGYYLYVGKASAQTRGNRESMPIKLWYTDGGSVHAVNMGSINIL